MDENAKDRQSERRGRRVGWRQKWKQTSLPNRLNVWLTGIIGLATVANVIFVGVQVRDSDRQVERITNTIDQGVGKAQSAINKSLSANRQALQKVAQDLHSENQAALDASMAHGKAAIQAAIDGYRGDQRAWVGLSFFTRPQIDVGKRFAISAQFRNSGRSPALDVRGSFKVAMLEPNEALDLSGLVPPTGRAVLQPGEKMTMLVDSTAPGHRGITEQGVRLIKSGQLRIFVHGVICYSDVFSVPHWTTFCNRFEPATGEFDTWETGSDVDRGGNPPHPICRAN